MKTIRKSYVLIVLFTFFLSLNNVKATTIRETLVNGDGYNTIEPGTFIIGITKFPGTEVITATKASIAGANDAMFYVMKNGTTKGYKAPNIYYYVDANIGWFVFDSNNNAFPVTDNETLEKLANIDIYYVSNVEKKIKVSYPSNNVNLDNLEEGLELIDNELYVDATKLNFTIETLDGKTINFTKDDTTSSYLRDNSTCYEVENGVIINYDSSCGENVVIPEQINNELIISIGANAFNNKGLKSVIIPSSIESIGDNAFSNNNLDNVTFDDKYDSTDFMNYSSNAFDDNSVINYDNDLTRALNSLPSTYTVKVYSGLNLNQANTDTLIRNAVLKEINTEKYNFHIDSSEINKYYNLHYYMGGGISNNPGECVDHPKGGFDIIFSINGAGRYSIYFQKKSDNCQRIITVDKEIKLTYEKVGNIADKLSVDASLNSLERTNDIVDEEIVNNTSIVTRRRNLEDFVDNNQLEYLYEPRFEQLMDPETDSEIGGSLTNGDLYLFKNDILYQVVEKVAVANLSNAYYSTLSYKDYDDKDTFINELIESFKTKTEIENYRVINLSGDRIYNENIAGANRVFYIALFNTDTLEYWSIFSKSIIESTYDESGFSKQSCFNINDGMITSYDGECGADVKIPNTINNQTVRKIGSNVFYNYGLKSVTLPNTLETIYSTAFYNNNIKVLNLPNSVIEVAQEAFAKNKIETLSIPNTLRSIGDGAFTDNQLPDNEAFIYAREYDGSTVRINNAMINSYAGKKRSNITIPNSVTNIGAKSFRQLGIESINIPYGITTIGYYAFEGNNISNISVPSSVEYIDWGVFNNNKFKGNNCFIYERSQDNQIDYSSLVSYSFYVPKGLYYKEVDKLEIPNTVKKIWSNAFSNEYILYVNNLDIPYGVEEIGDNAFYNVYFKQSFALPKSLTTIGMNVFSNLYGISSDDLFIYAKNEDESIDRSIIMGYIGDGYENEQKIVIPNGIKRIAANAFNNKYMSEVVLNDGIETIDHNAFANTYYLTKINFPTSLKKIEREAFINSNLRSITLNEGLEEIGDNAFKVINNFNTISIPSTVRIIGNDAFGYVSNVKIYGKSSIDEFEGGFYLSEYPEVNIEFIN